MACNCSRCRRLGSLLTFVPVKNFKLLAGEGQMTDFQFNKHVIHHHFCPTCGIQSFALGKGPDGSEMAAINVRCLDDVDVAAIKVMPFDGRNL